MSLPSLFRANQMMVNRTTEVMHLPGHSKAIFFLTISSTPFFPDLCHVYHRPVNVLHVKTLCHTDEMHAVELGGPTFPYCMAHSEKNDSSNDSNRLLVKE